MFPLLGSALSCGRCEDCIRCDEESGPIHIYSISSGLAVVVFLALWISGLSLTGNKNDDGSWPTAVALIHASSALGLFAYWIMETAGLLYLPSVEGCDRIGGYISIARASAGATSPGPAAASNRQREAQKEGRQGRQGRQPWADQRRISRRDPAARVRPKRGRGGAPAERGAISTARRRVVSLRACSSLFRPSPEEML